jgi:hypothetical protein
MHRISAGAMARHIPVDLLSPIYSCVGAMPLFRSYHRICCSSRLYPLSGSSAGSRFDQKGMGHRFYGKGLRKYSMPSA